MKVGDKVRIDTGIGYAVEGLVVAVFPNDGDANIRVRFEGMDQHGDYYEEELEVVS